MADINPISNGPGGSDTKGLLSLGCIVLQPWKIESSCRNSDNSWSYLVRWRDVWLHENICSKFSNLIDEYWKENGGKPTESDVIPEKNDNEIKTEQTSVFEIVKDMVTEPAIEDQQTKSLQQKLPFSDDPVAGQQQIQTDVLNDKPDEEQQQQRQDFLQQEERHLLTKNFNEGHQQMNIVYDQVDGHHEQGQTDIQTEVLDERQQEQTFILSEASSDEHHNQDQQQPDTISETVEQQKQEQMIILSGPAERQQQEQMVILSESSEQQEHMIIISEEIDDQVNLENAAHSSTRCNPLTMEETNQVLQRALPQLVKSIVTNSLKNSQSKEAKSSSSYKRTGPQNCNICEKTLSSRNSLREHLITVHFKNGRFPCDNPGCEKRFSNRRALRLHLVSHTGERNFVCEKCGSTHKRARELRLHMSDMHSQGSTHRCDVCFKSFREKGELKQHCYTFHEHTITECIVCKQKLTTPYSIYTHCLKHGGIRDFECDICKGNFKTQKALNDHKKIHDPDRKPFRVCPKCGKSLFSRSHYYEHVNSHDGKTNELVKFTCDICGNSFQHSSSLKRHTLRHRPGGDLEHPKENPYLNMDEDLLPSLCCRICRRNYTSKSGYYDHRRRCRDGVVTVVECDLCDKKYTKRSALNRHIRVHHPDMLTQFFEIGPEVDAMGVEIEPTTVEVLNVGETNENDEHAGVQVQFQVALAPVKDDDADKEGSENQNNEKSMPST